MRTRAYVYTSIWEDPDFMALTPGDQWLYHFLLGQKKMSIVGLLALQPDQWAKRAKGLTVERIETYLDHLAEARFVVVDRDTGEVLVRTLVRHDVTESWPASVAIWKAWREIDSNAIKSVLAREIPDFHWNATRRTKKGQIEVLVPEEALVMRGPQAPSKGAYEGAYEGASDPTSEGASDEGSKGPSDLGSEGAYERYERYEHHESMSTPVRARAKKPKKDGPILEGDSLESFEQFWAAYPRRVARRDAEKAWAKAITKETPDRIIAAARAYAETRNGKDHEHTAHGSTWLNGMRWTDEYQAVPNGKPQTAAERILLRMHERKVAV